MSLLTELEYGVALSRHDGSNFVEAPIADDRTRLLELRRSEIFVARGEEKRNTGIEVHEEYLRRVKHKRKEMS